MKKNINKNIEEHVENNNKSIKLLIVIIALIIILIGGTYAWYFITLQGTKQNVIKAGTLSLVLDESESIAIDLNNSVPISDLDGLNTTAYTFKLKNNGDISSSYVIYLDNMELELGETRMLDKYVKYSLTKDNGEPVTALLSTLGENPNRVLDSGIIKKDTTHIYTLRIWIDKDADNGVMNTTFRGKLRVEAAQTTGGMLCRRATTLHKEICSQTATDGYCSGAGYATGDTIVYGNLGTYGTLESGDAFDCDIDGNGEYNSETERFYYVSDYYNTTTKTIDTNTATLIYYNNTKTGIQNNNSSGKTAYYISDNKNWYGPKTVITNLPKTSQWKTTLVNMKRNIITETGSASTTGGSLPKEFSYVGYAARLLTVQEINLACGITIGKHIVGELDTCNYLMENTIYSSNSIGNLGYWLENPQSSTSTTAWNLRGYYRYVAPNSTAYADAYGTRPVIDVSKSNILF